MKTIASAAAFRSSPFANTIARVRLTLTLVLAIPLAAQQPALSPFQEQTARTLLHNRLSCLGCHELDGDGGRSAPSLTTVGQRRSAAYIRAIVEDPLRVSPAGAMPRINMTAPVRELVIRFLARNAPPGPSAPPAGRATSVARAAASAAALYARWCTSCHGLRGAGNGPNARYLPVPPAVHASAGKMRERPDDSLFDTIAGGGGVMRRSVRMPAFGATLSRDEIRSLVAYIRTLCSCTGPRWSRDGIAR